MKHEKLFRMIGWGAVAGMAGILALAFDSIFPSYWESNSSIRLLLFGITWIVFGTIINLWLSNVVKWVKAIAIGDLILIVTFAILLTALVSVWGGHLRIIIPTIAFSGNGKLIGRLINGFISFLLQPFFYTSIFLVCKKIYHSKRSILPGWVNQNLYNQIFIIIFIGALLTPWFEVPNYKNVGQDFWGRNWLIRTFSEIRVSLQDRVFDSSIIGANNWLIYSGELSMDDYQNKFPFSEKDLAVIQQKLDGLAERLAVKGVKKLIVVVPPNKNTIYPEYMPPEISKFGEVSRLDQLLNYEKQNGKVKILDVRPALFAEKYQNEVFYRTDTHWNDLGAFIAYQEIMHEVQNFYPNIKPHSINDFQFVPIKYVGDLSQNMVKTEFTEDTYRMEPLFDRKTTNQIRYGDKMDLNNIETLTNPDTTLPKLLMFGDSFSISLIPFIGDHFSRSVLIWSSPGDETDYDTDKPDIVIIEVTERLLSSLRQIPD